MSVTACVTYERRVEKPRVRGFAYYAGMQMLFRVLPSVFPYRFSSKRETARSLDLVQKRKIAQSLTRSTQTLKASTHLRTTGVMQACHKFLISKIF